MNSFENKIPVYATHYGAQYVLPIDLLITPEEQRTMLREARERAQKSLQDPTAVWVRARRRKPSRRRIEAQARTFRFIFWIAFFGMMVSAFRVVDSGDSVAWLFGVGSLAICLVACVGDWMACEHS